jgi:hypothetical protein
MSGIGHTAIAGALWMLFSMLWSAVVLILAELCGSRAKEHWPSYWLAALLVAVMPTLMGPIFYLAPLGIFNTELTVFVRLHESGEPILDIDGLFSLRVARHLATIGFFVYLSGAIFRFVALICNCRRAMAIVRTAVVLRRGSTFHDFSSIRLLSSQLTGSAFCLGGLQPAIVLSECLFAQLSREQIDMIIKHELAHINRRDPALFLALQFLDSLLWFDPSARRLSRRVRAAAEIACDEAALSGGTRHNVYADALVRSCEIASSSPAQMAAFGETGHLSRMRLSRILRKEHSIVSATASLVLISAAIGAGLSSAALAASTARLISLGEPAVILALGKHMSELYETDPVAAAACHCAPGALRR